MVTNANYKEVTLTCKDRALYRKYIEDESVGVWPPDSITQTKSTAIHYPQVAHFVHFPDENVPAKVTATLLIKEKRIHRDYQYFKYTEPRLQYDSEYAIDFVTHGNQEDAKNLDLLVDFLCTQGFTKSDKCSELLLRD